jgi:hypothetical protein
MATPTTLPATFVSGDILTAAQMNNLRGAFRVLQVVQGSLSTLASSASSTYADTGLTVSITPQSTSSKVLVIVSAQWQKSSANAGNGLNLQIVRNATALTAYGLQGFTGTSLQNLGSSTMTFLDSPTANSATTYKLQFANNFNGGTIYISSDGSTSTITVMEISA